MQPAWKLSVVAILGAWTLTATAPAPAAAQALAVQGGQFTVDGNPRFLAFVTYFDALDVPLGQLETDLHNLRHAVHVDGIRIFPNWWHQPSRGSSGRGNSATAVMDPAGNLRPDAWNRLVHVLDRARAHGLVVDVSWTAETVGPAGTTSATLSYPDYRAALGTATSWLAGPRFNHVLFDLQNESDLNGPQRVALSPDAARDLRRHVRAIDPQRIVTVSGGATPAAARSRADYAEQDVVAWHEPRITSWWHTAANDVAQMRASGKPAYLQEPPKLEDIPVSGEAFLRAAQEAKRAGAAAWCYHTSAGQWMDGGTGSNPSGGIWDRMTGAAPDSHPIDNVVIANLSPWLGEIPWPPGGGPGPTNVTFYWDIDYGGASFSSSGNVDFVGWDWNDRISSIRIPPGRTVTLYEHWYLGGATLTLTGDVSDLRNYGWNDWASSIRIQ